MILERFIYVSVVVLLKVEVEVQACKWYYLDITPSKHY